VKNFSDSLSRRSVFGHGAQQFRDEAYGVDAFLFRRESSGEYDDVKAGYATLRASSKPMVKRPSKSARPWRSRSKLVRRAQRTCSLTKLFASKVCERDFRFQLDDCVLHFISRRRPSAFIHQTHKRKAGEQDALHIC